MAVMTALESLSPEFKQTLDNNKMWQGLKEKSHKEIEQAATNLMRDKNVVTNIIANISPEMGEKVQKSPLLNTLVARSPADMGNFVIKITKMFGFLQDNNVNTQN